MNMVEILRLAADGLGPGAIGVSTPGSGVTSPSMRRTRGRTQVEADASPSDLASHHLYRDPSATDTTILDWRAKRQMEKQLHRNMDPFEWDAEKVIRASKCRCRTR